MKKHLSIILPILALFLFPMTVSAYSAFLTNGSCSENLTDARNPIVNCVNAIGMVEARCEQYPTALTLTLSMNGTSETINCGGICGDAYGQNYCDISDISEWDLCDDNALEEDAIAAGITNEASVVTENSNNESPLWTWTCHIPDTTDECYADFANNCGGGGQDIGCGGANGSTYTNIPTDGLCLVGCTASEVEAQDSLWTWNCESSSGDIFDCSANIGNNNGNGGDGPACAIPPAGASYEDLEGIPGALCQVGTATPVSLSDDSGPWYWICSNNGENVTCSTNQYLEGDQSPSASICGDLNGKKLSSIPDEDDPDLCAYGVLDGEILGDGPWTWACRRSWLTSVCVAGVEESNISIIGQARSLSLDTTSTSLDEESEREYGTFQFNEFSQTVNSNIVSILTDSIDTASGNVFIASNGTPSSGNYELLSGEQVYYIKNGNLIFSQDTTFSSTTPITYLVENGDIIIDGNLSYANNASVGFIVLNENGTGGNVYIDPSVTDTVGSFYMDGSFISASDTNGDNQISDSEIFYGHGDKFTNVKKNLINQLYHQGIFISRNTLYGGRTGDDSTLFTLPYTAIASPDTVGNYYLDMPDGSGEITSVSQFVSEYYDICSASQEQSVCTYPAYNSYQDLAKRFDLNYIRILNISAGGSRSSQIETLYSAGDLSDTIYNKSFIIHYDGKVLSATPPGFED